MFNKIIGKPSNHKKKNLYPSNFRGYEITNVSKEIGTYATGFNSSATNSDRFITLKEEQPFNFGDIEVVLGGGYWELSTHAWSTSQSDYRLNYVSYFSGNYWNKPIDIDKESQPMQEGCEYSRDISWSQHSNKIRGDVGTGYTSQHRTFFSPDRMYTTGSPTSVTMCSETQTDRKLILIINWDLVRSSNLGSQDFIRLF